MMTRVGRTLERATVIAAPVYSHPGAIIAAISVVGPCYRTGPAEENRFGAWAIEAAAKLAGDWRSTANEFVRRASAGGVLAR